MHSPSNTSQSRISQIAVPKARRLSRLRIAVAIAVQCALILIFIPVARANTRSLGTIAGIVKDSQDRPIANAVVTIVRGDTQELVKGIVRQVKTSIDGSFTMRLEPGRYALNAFAAGFNSVVFDDVDLKSLDRLVYLFRLEPATSGRTLPAQRKDRNDPRWRLRAAHGERSIFQLQDETDQPNETIASDQSSSTQDGLQVDQQIDQRAHRQTPLQMPVNGIVETYYSTGSALSGGFVGLNFAFAEHVGTSDFIIAGQTGLGSSAPQRIEITTGRQIIAGHYSSVSIGAGKLSIVEPTTRDTALARAFLSGSAEDDNKISQVTLRMTDEWSVKDGIVVVLGFDYARFFGFNQAGAVSILSPRFGVQYDVNSKTRVHAAYTPGGSEHQNARSALPVEAGGDATFKDSTALVAVVAALALREGSETPTSESTAQPTKAKISTEQSRRVEFGVERLLDSNSNLEATVFFDTTFSRPLGIFSAPVNTLARGNGAVLFGFTNQQGSARGLRVIYARRFATFLSAAVAYSYGAGQAIDSAGISAGIINPERLFKNSSFQTAAAQLDAALSRTTRVKVVYRLSPKAALFAIDPFAGHLALYDPSLSILISQEMPSFGLPLEVEAVVDARNLLGYSPVIDDTEGSYSIGMLRRSVRGGISVRF